MLGIGVAILSMLLGALADEVGLRLAHLMVPGLATIVLFCVLVAQALKRRAIAPVSCL